MFESIVSKITNVVRNTVRAVGAVTRKSPWLVPVAILALFFLFITVVYNYSFARLIFVSGLDQRLPKAMSHVNKARVPDTAVWVQTAFTK